AVPASRTSDLRLLPVGVLTADGAEITPSGAAWSLKRAADGWSLLLSLDDDALPTPYVIQAELAIPAAAPALHATAGAIVLPRPAGTAGGDLMLAQVTAVGASRVQAPAGWSLVRRDAASALVQSVYFRVASPTDPVSWRWRLSGGRSVAGGIVSYTGVDLDDPIAATAHASGDGQRIVSPSLTTTAPSTIVGFLGGTSTAYVRVPGAAERLFADARRGGAWAQAMGTVQSRAGRSGALTSTASTPLRWIAQAVALQPAGTRAAAPVTIAKDGRLQTRFVQQQLGAPAAAAPLQRTPDRRVRVRIGAAGGYSVSANGEAITLRSPQPGAGAWQP